LTSRPRKTAGIGETFASHHAEKPASSPATGQNLSREDRILLTANLRNGIRGQRTPHLSCHREAQRFADIDAL
jgi:hypothetical protein